MLLAGILIVPGSSIASVSWQMPDSVSMIGIFGAVVALIVGALYAKSTM